MADTFTIGSRNSPLAITQARKFADDLIQLHGWEKSRIKIKTITTSGDKFKNVELRTIGGKGLFTKEIEQELLKGNIDCAVHSAKDMQIKLPDGLKICAILARETPCEAFISKKYPGFAELPSGSIIGTASLRRQAIVRHLRPDLQVELMRGNVGTRLQLIENGKYDATLLALSGLKRLNIANVATEIFSPEQFPPAPAQGALAIQTRIDDHYVIDLIKPLADIMSALTVAAERAFLARLEGSCQTPIAAYATISAEIMQIAGLIAFPDGSEVFKIKSKTSLTSPVSIAKTTEYDNLIAQATRFGATTAQKLIDDIGQGRIDQIRSYV